MNLSLKLFWFNLINNEVFMCKIEVDNLTESGAFYEIAKMTSTRLRNFVFALLSVKVCTYEKREKG